VQVVQLPFHREISRDIKVSVCKNMLIKLSQHFSLIKFLITQKDLQ